MVTSVETQIDIAVPAADVWRQFADFSSYASEGWNPMILRLEGEPKVGNYLSVDIKQPEMSTMTFKPVVTAAEKGHEFAWKGRLYVPWLFDGHHTFRFVPSEDGQRTTFYHAEHFSGILVYLMFSETMHANITKGFESFNGALKRRCEATVEQTAQN